MSRKDYVALAEIVEATYAEPDLISPEEWGRGRRMAERMADHFENDNPNFDRERFLIACGFGVTA